MRGSVVMTGAGRRVLLGAGSQRWRRRRPILDLERVLRDEYVPMLRAIIRLPGADDQRRQRPGGRGGGQPRAGRRRGDRHRKRLFPAGLRADRPDPRCRRHMDWLPRQMGMAKAMGAALFAEPISARQASDWGMIWEAVSHDDAFEALAGARRASGAGDRPQTYRAAKQAIRGTGTTRSTPSSISRRSCKANADKAGISRKAWWPFSTSAYRASRAAVCG